MAKELPTYDIERSINGLVCGCDEAGRAPLCGPVTAAAVILNEKAVPEGINDSKKLSASKREKLAESIKASAVAYHIEHIPVEVIDEINILHASMLAMQRCVEALSPQADFALIDGNRLPKSLPCDAEAIIKGDSKSFSIAAASILAKTARDELMQQLAEEFPGYGWERNAGYPTKEHLEALEKLGVTPHHRCSFGPVKKALLVAA
jgi:ribonuclease HII